MGNYSLKSVGLQNIHLQEDQRTFDDNAHLALGELIDVNLDDAAAGDRFGHSISRNHNTIAVGIPGRNQVALYTYAGGEVEPLAVISGPVGSVEFGYAVSMHGNLMVVGDPGYNADMGRVYSYEFKRDEWRASRMSYIDITNSEVDTDTRFGSRVVLQSNTVFVGAPLAKGSGSTRVGAIYPYEFSHIRQAWTNLARILSPTPVADSQFGSIFAVDRANTIVVGLPSIARNLGETLSGVGIVEIHSRSGEQGNFWIYDTLLAPTSGSADMHFGSAVSIASDQVVVGAPGASKCFMYAGFGSNWTLLHTFEGAAGSGEKVSFNPSIRTVALASTTKVEFHQLTAAGNWKPAGEIVEDFGPMNLSNDTFIMGTPAAESEAGALIVVPLE